MKIQTRRTNGVVLSSAILVGGRSNLEAEFVDGFKEHQKTIPVSLQFSPPTSDLKWQLTSVVVRRRLRIAASEGHSGFYQGPGGVRLLRACCFSCFS